jgi:hypothetical protein
MQNFKIIFFYPLGTEEQRWSLLYGKSSEK